MIIASIANSRCFLYYLLINSFLEEIERIMDNDIEISETL